MLRPLCPVAHTGTRQRYRVSFLRSHGRCHPQAEIAKYEQEQGVEEEQRVAIIRDLQERAASQRTSNDAWAVRVEEAQAMADQLAKKVRD